MAYRGRNNNNNNNTGVLLDLRDSDDEEQQHISPPPPPHAEESQRDFDHKPSLSSISADDFTRPSFEATYLFNAKRSIRNYGHSVTTEVIQAT